jgi:hypothetical protein
MTQASYKDLCPWSAIQTPTVFVPVQSAMILSSIDLISLSMLSLVPDDTRTFIALLSPSPQFP